MLISNILTWGKTPQKVKTEVEIANMDVTEEEYVEPSCAGDEQNEGDDMEYNNNNNNGGEHEEKEDDDNNNNNKKIV